MLDRLAKWLDIRVTDALKAMSDRDARKGHDSLIAYHRAGHMID